MDIQLSTRVVLHLTEIARQQGREMNEILTEAIEQYVERNVHEADFRQLVREVMAEQKWLLDELAER